MSSKTTRNGLKIVTRIWGLVCIVVLGEIFVVIRVYYVVEIYTTSVTILRT